MAAFPDPAYFVLDPFLEPERSNNIITANPCFSPFLSHEYEQEVPFPADETIHQLVHDVEVPPNFTRESLVNVNEKSCSSSWMVNDVACTGAYQDSTLINTVQPKRKHIHLERRKSSNSWMSDFNGRLSFDQGEKESKGENRWHPENSERKRMKPRARKEKKVADEEQPSTNYVHVRARRGEATDPHSLAERVRRKKINVRMKLLQSLVPGCDKLTGKALILDEIIRYVLLLQNQVEFLAAKLASDNGIANGMNYDINTQVIKELFSSELQESSSTGQLISFMEATPTSMLGGNNSII